MIELICGHPGSGKSYTLAYRAIKARKKRNVFTSFAVAGCYKLEEEHLMYSLFPENSLLLIDETGSKFNSRNWSKFPMEVFELFSMHRHMRLDMVVATQDSMFVDTNIRRLAQWFWWMKNYPFCFIGRLYYKMEDIGHKDDRCKGKSIVPKRKKYFNVFDSYSEHLRLDRRQYDFESWTVEEQVRSSWMLKFLDL